MSKSKNEVDLAMFIHQLFLLRKSLLLKWLDDKGIDATYSALVECMYNAREINLIDELIGLLKGKAQRTHTPTHTEREEQ